MTQHLSGEIFQRTRISYEAAGSSVAVMVRTSLGMLPPLLARELQLLIKMILSKNLMPVITSEKARKFSCSPGTIVESFPISDLSPINFRGIIIPHMPIEETAIEERDPFDMIDFVREFHALGRAIAAQNSGVLLLARAGILDGREYAAEQRYACLIPRGIFRGECVVTDHNIITAASSRRYSVSAGIQNRTLEMLEKFWERV